MHKHNQRDEHDRVLFFTSSHPFTIVNVYHGADEIAAAVSVLPQAIHSFMCLSLSMEAKLPVKDI